jgi:hypothetical protein
MYYYFIFLFMYAQIIGILRYLYERNFLIIIKKLTMYKQKLNIIYVFHHTGLTYQQVRMLPLLQNRHQQLFCIKITKNFSSYLLF